MTEAPSAKQSKLDTARDDNPRHLRVAAKLSKVTESPARWSQVDASSFCESRHHQARVLWAPEWRHPHGGALLSALAGETEELKERAPVLKLGPCSVLRAVKGCRTQVTQSHSMKT